jgi:quinol monooxygenase YgiN
MSTFELTALGIIRAKPGKSREVGRRLQALVAPTRAEPGCVAYDLHQSTDDPSVWVIIEAWRSASDLDAHIATAHMAGFLAGSDEVLDGPPDSFRLQRRPVGVAA